MFFPDGVVGWGMYYSLHVEREIQKGALVLSSKGPKLATDEYYYYYHYYYYRL
jgi:hypothetical protein